METDMEKAIIKYGESNPLQIYKHAKTYDDFAYINTQFLSGRMSRSCGFTDRIFPETVPLLEDFIKLSTIGIITTESQPGDIEKYDSNSDSEYKNLNFGLKREWISFIIETRKLKHLCKILEDTQNTDNPIYFEYINKHEKYNSNPKYFLKTPLIVKDVGENNIILTLQSNNDGSWEWESTRTIGKSISKNWVKTTTECLTNHELITYIKEECTNMFVLSFKFGKNEKTIAKLLLKNFCINCGESKDLH